MKDSCRVELGTDDKNEGAANSPQIARDRGEVRENGMLSEIRTGIGGPRW
jgi:hypothetical protein